MSPSRPGENTAAVAARAVVDAVGSGASDVIGSLAAIGIVAVVVVVMVVTMRVRRAWPASLLAVVVATVVAQAFGLDVARIGALPGSLPLPALPRPVGL